MASPTKSITPLMMQRQSSVNKENKNNTSMTSTSSFQTNSIANLPPLQTKDYISTTPGGMNQVLFGSGLQGNSVIKRVSYPVLTP